VTITGLRSGNTDIIISAGTLTRIVSAVHIQ
jgi:hypothetical protein